MERRRNRPEKYNRELVHKTVQAMERISEVRLLQPSLADISHTQQLIFHTPVHRQALTKDLKEQPQSRRLHSWMAS